MRKNTDAEHAAKWVFKAEGHRTVLDAHHPDHLNEIKTKHISFFTYLYKMRQSSLRKDGQYKTLSIPQRQIYNLNTDSDHLFTGNVLCNSTPI